MTKKENIYFDIDDESFAQMKWQLNAEMRHLVSEMYTDGDDEGTLTLKINFKIEEDVIKATGEAYEKLTTDYKITAAVTRKSTSDGTLNSEDGYRLGTDFDGNVMLEMIPDPQHSIDEYL